MAEESEDAKGEVPADGFAALWHRLKEHRIAQGTVGYVAVAYWRATGWPDLCHPVGADDFACN